MCMCVEDHKFYWEWLESQRTRPQNKKKTNFALFTKWVLSRQPPFLNPFFFLSTPQTFKYSVGVGSAVSKIAFYSPDLNFNWQTQTLGQLPKKPNICQTKYLQEKPTATHQVPKIHFSWNSPPRSKVFRRPDPNDGSPPPTKSASKFLKSAVFKAENVI